MDKKLESFNSEMLNIYELAKKECNYTARRYLQMLRRRGGLETAKRLLHSKYSNKASAGYIALRECGRLDLTVEALVIKMEWRELFTPEEINIATKRLKDYGFDIKE
jgi:hypothetical protein